MADITLTAAVRTNLNTLQSTASLIGQTQERLSTGKKVNSALDNPNSFFTSSSLNARASDLSNLQDDIGQSVSTLEASDKGIQAIDKLLDAAKGKANQALQSKDSATRAKYASEFNELRTQIQDIAKDSGYKGKNLLGGDGNDLLVKFNEDGSSKLNISAVDYTNLDSDTSSLKLGGIEETVAEVKESDGKQTFKLGITSDDILRAAAGTGTATGATALTDGTDAPGLAEAAVSATVLTEGSTFTVDGFDAIKLTSTTTVQDVRDTLQAKIRETAGNQDATVSYDTTAGTFTVAGAGVTTTIGYDPAPGDADSFTDIAVTGVGPNTDVTAVKLKDLDIFNEGDSITISDNGGIASNLVTVGASNTVQDLINAVNGTTGLTAGFDGTKGEITLDNTTKGSTGSTFTLGYTGDGNGGDFKSSAKQTIERDVDAVAGRGWGSDKLIEESLDEIRQAQLDLRAQASTFGTNLSVVTNRQDFTKNLINTLEVGAGKLTLADTNLEGANLAALNTQNSIATSTLALATQASQSVLQLIR